MAALIVKLTIVIATVLAAVDFVSDDEQLS